MKITSVIIILIFLIQFLIPCDDEFHSEHSNFEQELVKVENIDIYNDSEETDNCPPLCTCHCCHSHVLTNMQDNLTEQPLVTFTKNTLSLDILNNYIKIPPKPPQV